ncbi:lytic transglycosylase domain-containing protein [Burkholderia sp. WSM2230]|uniref:lytic transglycosylase domain-containing protein n=1 Tax=Burkholderia sp. WSM2230 TaxID=944435 RepID=UPI00041E61C7|nr:lytic transglycosylase domain-containing protein [Burkholderia sp. WSM2230]
MARRLLLVAIAASGACLPLRSHAVDAVVTRVRPAPGVVMMVGGMAGAAEPVGLTVRAAPRAVAYAPDDAGGRQSGAYPPDNPDGRQSVAYSPDDADGRQSVVIQPGRESLRGAVRQSSALVAARVMALWPIINEAARAAGLDSALLMAVIDVESGGNPQAVSPKGATSLMQLMPGTGARHGASDLFDAGQNVAAGARYLKELMRQFGDLPLALAAYNAGEGAVQKYGGQIPPYAETQSYVPRVIARYRWYRSAASSMAMPLGAELADGVNGRLFAVGSRGRN